MRRNLISRTPLTAILSALGFSLLLQGLAFGADAPGPATDDLYQAYSTHYFAQRAFGFESQMANNERFLAWLYQGINAEVDRRRSENPAATLDAITPPELHGLEDTVYSVPSDLGDAPLRIKYMAWEKVQSDEFNQKFYEARTIKDRLIDSSTPTQRMRMFRWDLESAISSFSDGYYGDAIARFSEAIEKYGYQNVSDLYFYRGESFLAVRLGDLARDDYLKVLDAQDPDYQRSALERLVVLAGDAGDARNLDQYWSDYAKLTEAAPDADYWRVLDLAARYYFSLRRWETARDLFDKIPESSDRFGLARLRSGDCSLAIKDMDRAEQYYLQIYHPVDKKAAKRVAPYEREADLKLGYISFLRADYQGAIDHLSRIHDGDDTGEKALLVTAWSWYYLGAYGRAHDACTELLKDYPTTQYYYEVNCLVGFCGELTEAAPDSTSGYEVVMSSMDSRQDYHDFNYETQAVRQAYGTLEQLEPLLFVGGESDLFDQYLSLSRRLSMLREQIRLTEGVKNNHSLQAVLDERGELIQVVQDASGVADQIDKSQDLKLSRDYEKLGMSLSDLNNELNRGIAYYLSRKPLVQREEEANFQAMAGDSIMSQLRREWDAAVKGLGDLEHVSKQAAATGDTELLFALAGVEANFASVQGEVIDERAALGNLDVPQMNSNLDWWGWFAYRRHGKEFVRFDDYYARQGRVDQLDNYIAAINDIVQKREAEQPQIAAVPAGLIPASAPGQPPYVGPPAPMWKSPTPPAPPTPAKTDTTGAQAAPADTTGAKAAPADTTGASVAPPPVPADTTGAPPPQKPEPQPSAPTGGAAPTAPSEPQAGQQQGGTDQGAPTKPPSQPESGGGKQ